MLSLQGYLTPAARGRQRG